MNDVRMCHECQVQSSVYDARPAQGGKVGVFRRRRRCPNCDARWNTIEISEVLFEKLVADTHSQWLDSIEKLNVLANEIRSVMGQR